MKTYSELIELIALVQTCSKDTDDLEYSFTALSDGLFESNPDKAIIIEKIIIEAKGKFKSYGTYFEFCRMLILANSEYMRLPTENFGNDKHLTNLS